MKRSCHRFPRTMRARQCRGAGSIFTNKYAEGYPSRRYYAAASMGCFVENLGDRAGKDDIRPLSM